MKVRILEPDGFPIAAIERLSRVGPVALGGGDIVDPDCTVIFVRLAQQVDSDIHDRYPALEYIVSPTTGLNHIDGDYFAAAGIRVLSLKGRTDFLDRIHATAEHTLALALALLRDLPSAAAAVNQGDWNRYPHKGRELNGKRVLLLGFGRIGRLVAPLFEAFGCNVRAHDLVADKVPARYVCQYPAVLADTDILSIHLPYDRSTHGLVTREAIARLPTNAIVINTARGEVIDQTALLEAVCNGAIAGAALDVLEGEPAPLTAEVMTASSRNGSRLLITPHIGGFTHESLELVENYMTDIFLSAIREGR